MIPVFKTIQRIKETVRANTSPTHVPYEINVIRDAIIEHTLVDKVDYIEIDDPDNPIMGRFEPYYIQANGVYDHDPDYIVEVHFRKNLNLCWSRYVACKEMCHAFTATANKAAQVQTAERLERLVEMLVMEEKEKEMILTYPPMIDEKMAEFAALQILFPFEDRQKISGYRKPDSSALTNMEIAARFRIPRQFVPVLMEPTVMEIDRQMLLGETEE